MVTARPRHSLRIDREDEFRPVLPQPDDGLPRRPVGRQEFVDQARRAPQPAIGVFLQKPHLAQRIGRAPMAPEPMLRGRRVLAQRQDGIGDRDQPVQVERAAAGLVPAREHLVMTGGDDLAQLAGQRPRHPPLPRHRRQQTRLLVIEIEMPRNAAGAPGRCTEPRHLRGWAAHRQPMAQPVGPCGIPSGSSPSAGPRRARLHRVSVTGQAAAPGCRPRCAPAADSGASNRRPCAANAA